MKKVFSVLLCLSLIMGCLAFTSCGDNNSDNDEQEEEKILFNYIAVKDVAEEQYSFMEYQPYEMDDDAVFCEVPADVTGDIEIPSEYDGHPVAAVVAQQSEEPLAYQITSLTVGEGVLYIDGFSQTKDLKTLNLPDSIKRIYDSFSDCPYIEELGPFKQLEYIKNSFNRCDALMSVSVTGSGIDNSFNQCSSLQSADLDCYVLKSFCDCPVLDSLTFHSVEYQSLMDSFNNCALKSLEFKENIESTLSIENCFNQCEFLETVNATCDVFRIENSYNNDPVLTEAIFEGEKMYGISYSFCDCESLKTVKVNATLSNTDASFENCPLLKESPSGFSSSLSKKEIEELDATREEREEEARKEAEKKQAIEDKAEKEFNKLQIALSKLSSKEDEYETIFDNALKKLSDDGAIPEISDKDYQELQFEDSGNGYVPVFYDQNVRQRLFSDPDFTPENMVLLDASGTVFWLSHYMNNSKKYHRVTTSDEFEEHYRVGGSYAVDPSSARYLIYYRGFISNVKEDYYQGGFGRATTTTVVFIIDLKTKEIVHMEAVRDSSPDTNMVQIGGNVHLRGNVVYLGASEEGANEYIGSLIY